MTVNDYLFRLDNSIPKPKHLGIACICLFLVPVMTFFLALFFSNYKSVVANAKLSEAIVNKDFVRSDKYLNILKNPSYTMTAWEGIFGNIAGLSNNLASLNALIDSLKHAYKSEYKVALTFLENSKQASWGEDEFNSKYIKRVNDIENQLKNIVQLNIGARKKSRVLPDLKQSLLRLVAKHKLIAEDFSDLMGLDAVYRANLSNKSELYFYKDGVLKGLPKLEKLGDDIMDLPTFRKRLGGLRARINPEYASSFELFQEKFEYIRKASQELVTDYAVTKNIIKKMETDLKEEKNKLEQVRNNVLQIGQDVILHYPLNRSSL